MPRKTQPDIGTWGSISDLLRDVNRTAKNLNENVIDDKKAKVMCTLFRCGATLVSIMLKHAQTTGRLKRNQTTLAGFKLT